MDQLVIVGVGACMVVKYIVSHFKLLPYMKRLLMMLDKAQEAKTGGGYIHVNQKLR